MVTIRATPERRGRSASRDFVLMLLVLFLLLVGATRLFVPDSASDSLSFGQRVLNTLSGLIGCFGLLVATGFLLALLETVKHYLIRSYARRLEDNLTRLAPLARDATGRADSQNFALVLPHLGVELFQRLGRE